MTRRGQKNLSDLSEYGFSDTREPYAKNLTLLVAKEKINITQDCSATNPEQGLKLLAIERRRYFDELFNIAKNVVKLTLIYI